MATAFIPLEAPPHRAPRQELPAYQRGDDVALFIPCYMDQFFPEAAHATAEVLQRLGARVIFPEDQTCCGQPAFNSGYWDEARRVVRHFCRVFERYRWIVCPSGSCAAMCRVFFEHLDASEAVVDVGRRVFEFSEFLVDILGVTECGATFPHRVALHVGCHGRRELGVVSQPAALLANVRGLSLMDVPMVEECCGFGGTFSVKMPGTSLAMGRDKVANLVRSGAEVVVSTDVSCLMHIGGIANHKPTARAAATVGASSAQPLRFVHLAEVLNARQ